MSERRFIIQCPECGSNFATGMSVGDRLEECRCFTCLHYWKPRFSVFFSDNVPTNNDRVIHGA